MTTNITQEMLQMVSLLYLALTIQIQFNDLVRHISYLVEYAAKVVGSHFSHRMWRTKTGAVLAWQVTYFPKIESRCRMLLPSIPLQVDNILGQACKVKSCSG